MTRKRPEDIDIVANYHDSTRRQRADILSRLDAIADEPEGPETESLKMSLLKDLNSMFYSKPLNTLEELTICIRQFISEAVQASGWKPDEVELLLEKLNKITKIEESKDKRHGTLGSGNPKDLRGKRY